MSADSTPREAEFEALYARDPDPWRMETSAYEAAKYDATLAALPPGPIGTALEVGCSIGVLTARLARRCDRVLALDVSPTALARARERPDTATVEWRRAEVPRDWPQGTYDLVVLSEVLYFLEPDELRETARLVARDLASRGTVLLVNWLGPCDRTLTGDAAAELFARCAATHGLARAPGTRTDLYRLDRLTRS